jgi:hypothetical protein
VRTGLPPLAPQKLEYYWGGLTRLMSLPQMRILCKSLQMNPTPEDVVEDVALSWENKRPKPGHPLRPSRDRVRLTAIRLGNCRLARQEWKFFLGCLPLFNYEWALGLAALSV